MKVVAALFAAAAVLIAVELGMGARSFGETRSVNPCTAESPDLGGGLDATIQRAVRAGLVRAIDKAEGRGDVPGFLAPVLRETARDAPLAFLINEGSRLSDVLGELFR